MTNLIKMLTVGAILGLCSFVGAVTYAHIRTPHSVTEESFFPVTQLNPKIVATAEEKKELEFSKPKTQEEVQKILAMLVQTYFLNGDYYAEFGWDPINGGITDLLILPLAEWKARHEDDEPEETPDSEPQ